MVIDSEITLRMENWRGGDWDETQNGAHVMRRKGYAMENQGITLRWLNTVSSTYIWMGRYNHSLSLDAIIMVSKNCSIIGEHVVIIFLTL